MTLATVGKRYQVVIPRKERKLLSLKPHTKVNVMVEDGRLVVQPCEGCDWRGIGKDLRDGSDATDYVRKLRSEWETGA